MALLKRFDAKRLKTRLRRSRAGSKFVIAVPYLWLLVFFLIPFVIVLKISFADQAVKIPPYTNLVSYDPDMSETTVRLAFYNYQALAEDLWQTLKGELNPFNLIASITPQGVGDWFGQMGWLSDQGQNIQVRAYVSSFFTAALTTLFCLLLGYPMAYGIAQASPARRNVLLLAVMIPFWTSLLLRVYAWMGLLSQNGLINNFLRSIGLQPMDLFYNTFSLLLIMTYAYLPFMVLPLCSDIMKLDRRLLEAAGDLGARPLTAFWRVTLPMTKAGIISGSMLVFIPCVGEFVIPDLVAGPGNLMVGKVLWNAFFDQYDWPQASSIAVVMLALLVLPIGLYNRYETRHLAKEGK